MFSKGKSIFLIKNQEFILGWCSSMEIAKKTERKPKENYNIELEVTSDVALTDKYNYIVYKTFTAFITSFKTTRFIVFFEVFTSSFFIFKKCKY